MTSIRIHNNNDLLNSRHDHSHHRRAIMNKDNDIPFPSFAAESPLASTAASSLSSSPTLPLYLSETITMQPNDHIHTSHHYNHSASTSSQESKKYFSSEIRQDGNQNDSYTLSGCNNSNMSSPSSSSSSLSNLTQTQQERRLHIPHVVYILPDPNPYVQLCFDFMKGTVVPAWIGTMKHRSHHHREEISSSSIPSICHMMKIDGYLPSSSVSFDHSDAAMIDDVAQENSMILVLPHIPSFLQIYLRKRHTTMASHDYDTKRMGMMLKPSSSSDTTIADDDVTILDDFPILKDMDDNLFISSSLSSSLTLTSENSFSSSSSSTAAMTNSFTVGSLAIFHRFYKGGNDSPNDDPGLYGDNIEDDRKCSYDWYDVSHGTDHIYDTIWLLGTSSKTTKNCDVDLTTPTTSIHHHQKELDQHDVRCGQQFMQSMHQLYTAIGRVIHLPIQYASSQCHPQSKSHLSHCCHHHQQYNVHPQQQQQQPKQHWQCYHSKTFCSTSPSTTIRSDCYRNYHHRVNNDNYCKKQHSSHSNYICLYRKNNRYCRLSDID